MNFILEEDCSSAFKELRFLYDRKMTNLFIVTKGRIQLICELPRIQAGQMVRDLLNNSQSDVMICGQ